MAFAGNGMPPSPSASIHRRSFTGGKFARHLLTSLESLPPDRAARRLLSVRPSPTRLNQVISHLLSSSPSLAASLYQTARTEPWFRFDPHLAAAVAAVLASTSGPAESLSLVAAASSSFPPRADVLFRCALVESYAARGLPSMSSDVLSPLLDGPAPPSVKRKACRAAVRGLCAAGLPAEAEAAVGEMQARGLPTSAFEFGVLAVAYGRSGLLSEMSRVLERMESSGWELDNKCFSAVISCHGARGDLAEVLRWVRRMRISGVPMSVHTYNAASNACVGFFAMVRVLEGMPASIGEAIGRLLEAGLVEESAVIEELSAGTDVLAEVCKWGVEEWKMDLHGCHPGAAFLVLFLWMKELRRRFRAGECAAKEVSVVCGIGRHSSVKRESPVRMIVAKVLRGSPLRRDRKNPGRYIAKGKAVREWLLSL